MRTYERNRDCAGPRGYGGSMGQNGNQTMPMKSPQEFFVHEMQDLLGAEQLVLKALPKLIEKTAGDGSRCSRA